MTTRRTLRGNECAGFDIYGERLADGSILLGHSEPKEQVPAFPEEIVLRYPDESGAWIYTLEFVRENGISDDGKTVDQWRQDAAPDDERLRICWGVYV